MTQNISLPRPAVALLIAALLPLLLLAAPVHAEESPNPQLRITKVDTQQFPDVGVYVFGQNLGEDLGGVPLTLSEDGRVQAVTGSELVDVGTQTVLLIDASEDIRKPGQTGDPRYTEVSNTLVRLNERQIMSAQSDWVAAYAPAAGGKIQPIKDWTRDLGAVRNDLYSYEPVKGIGETPLAKLIYFGLDKFNDPQLDPSAQRSMFLFSDGIDNVGGLEIDDAIARANAMNVRINTVLLGSGTKDSRSNLERIAIMTGGQFVPLTSVNAVDPVWDSIVQGRQQRVLSYRSKNATPEEVAVAAQLAGGGSIEAKSAIDVPPMDPVEVQILQPAADSEFVREGQFYTTPVTSLVPVTIPIQAVFTWPEGRPRTLQRVEYTLGNDTRTVDIEPFDSIEFPIEALGEGNYAVRVRAIDELGLAGESQPLSVRIKVNTPPPPTPVPSPTPIPDSGVFGAQNMRWLTLASLALALVALFFAIFVLVRKPAVRVMATQALSGTIKAVTQPFTLDRRMKGGQEAVKAKLVLVEGDASLPQTIEIHGSNTRIGRDPSLSNVVLEDARVSRYHCRISEEADGSFRIFDEGSTSGTYVNYKPVDIRGQTLQDGDQIHIGPIGLRFELSTASAPVKKQDEATLVYIPQFEAGQDDDPFKTEPFKLQTPERKDGS